MFQPVILFAGEHTHSNFYSTVHGAFLSGRTAAQLALASKDPEEIVVDCEGITDLSSWVQGIRLDWKSSLVVIVNHYYYLYSMKFKKIWHLESYWRKWKINVTVFVIFLTPKSILSSSSFEENYWLIKITYVYQLSYVIQQRK